MNLPQCATSLRGTCHTFAKRRTTIAAALFAGLTSLLIAASAMAQPTLFDRIGIGSDWGPHWAKGAAPQDADVRDSQDDGAFPAEICLVRNAGFKTIRMYGETADTWLAALDAIDDYNKGNLKCDPNEEQPGKCGDSRPCMSLVYQVDLCGPDPSSLTWNGKYDDIDTVRCHKTNEKFADVVLRETNKLKRVLRYAGQKFADNVPVVIVGNEILYSRGVCEGSTQACTEDHDCGSGKKCEIKNYCSNQLSSSVEPVVCNDSLSCGIGNSCTDVTNFEPLKYAFEQVKETLTAGLPEKAELPKLTISLQADVLAAYALGGDMTTAPLRYSRQLLKDLLTDNGKVLAFNVYPDQWGKVTSGPVVSCIDQTNAVKGDLLLPECTDKNKYMDARTNVAAHSIEDYRKLFQSSYYEGLDLLIAETGWHTNGTCDEYNDSKSTYSPEQAAQFYKDLYDYVQKKQIALLAFELFDQKTKRCETSTQVPAEANYGIFTHSCETKKDRALYASFLPQGGPGSMGANLDAFEALLDENHSCGKQTLVKVVGKGDTGVCYHTPEYSCMSGYIKGSRPADNQCPPAPDGGNNPCVWGVCSNLNPVRGCNADDPANKADGCNCVRAGACANNSAPKGVYYAIRQYAGTTLNASCWTDSACDDAIAPFKAPQLCKDAKNCACYAAMAPATVSQMTLGNKSTPIEGPGFNLVYSSPDNRFTFRKNRTLSQRNGELPASGEANIDVQAVWGNIFLGDNWKLKIKAPEGTTVHGDPCRENTVDHATPNPPNEQAVSWHDRWSTLCGNYPAGGVTTAARESEIHFPRGFLEEIPVWPPKQANLLPHRPSSWPDKIVISKQMRSAAGTDVFRTTDQLYVDWAAINLGERSTLRPFHCTLYVDGVKEKSWKRLAKLKPGQSVQVKDHPIGSLAAGTHRIEIKVDSHGTVNESNESDNTYAREITVIEK